MVEFVSIGTDDIRSYKRGNGFAARSSVVTSWPFTSLAPK